MLLGAKPHTSNLETDKQAPTKGRSVLGHPSRLRKCHMARVFMWGWSQKLDTTQSTAGCLLPRSTVCTEAIQARPGLQ